MSTPVEQAQDDALLAENVESDSSSAVSDDEEDIDITPAPNVGDSTGAGPSTGTDTVPTDSTSASSSTTTDSSTEPKKEKKKRDPSKEHTIAFNLAACRRWGAEFFTKTDVVNMTKSFGQLPVNNANNGALSFSLDNSVKNQPKYAYLTLDEGGVTDLNYVMTLIFEKMAERCAALINLKRCATLTDDILDQAIKATFPPEFSEIFLSDMDKASTMYASQKATKEVPPAEVPTA